MRYGTSSLVAACLCLAFVHVQAASPDPYLEMLDEEAAKLDLINDAERLDQEAIAKSGGVQAHGAEPALASGLSREQFDQVIKTRFVGTNSLYDKLPEHDRQGVYASYQRDSRLMEIRKAIVNHMQGDN